MKHSLMISAAGALAATFICSGAFAQESSATPGTVWQITSIKTEPGQFENYMDWLSANWKKLQEIEKKDGSIVSYHVYTVNNTRAGEPDVILAVEFKDYLTNAQRLALQKKIEAEMALDTHKSDAAFGERKKLRDVVSSVELQEIKLK